MSIEQRRQATAILNTQLVEQVVLGDRLFDQDGIDQHQAVLEKLQGEGRDFLLFATIAGPDPLSAIAEKVIRFIPSFDHIQPFVDLVTQVNRRQVLADYVEYPLPSVGGTDLYFSFADEGLL